MWKKEDPIPETDQVYMRVHRTYLENSKLPPGSIPPGAFSPKPKLTDGLSVDWSKYSSAADTRTRQGNPQSVGVVSMEVGSVRAVSPLEVLHDPIQQGGKEKPNRAHSLIQGIQANKTKLRAKLSQIASWEIPFE